MRRRPYEEGAKPRPTTAEPNAMVVTDDLPSSPIVMAAELHVLEQYLSKELSQLCELEQHHKK
jgi:hypothetical protein